MKTFKRALSVLLAATLILTTFFVFDPSVFFPTAEAVVRTTEPSYGNLYFVVPEAIYLKPVYNSYKTTTKSTFQWYINNDLENKTTVVPKNWDDDTQTGEFTTGNIIFRYPGASSVKISYKWQSEPGNDYDGIGNITYGDGVARKPKEEGYQLGLINGVGTASIMWGNSPNMEAGTSGVWICWIATFTDSNDNMEKQAYAYTYMYKPYVGPVAVGIRGKNTRGSNHYGSYMSWISGVHGIAAEKDGAEYPRTGSDHGFLPFSSSGSGLELGDNLNLQFPNCFGFPNTNEGPGKWCVGSQTDVPNRTVYTKSSTSSAHSSGSDYVLTYAYSPTAKLTVDTSRYTNLNQIPNLTVGLMVTDDESSESGASYFLSNFTAHTSLFDSDFTDYWHIGEGKLSDYWGPLSSGGWIAAKGMESMDASEGEGVKFNSRWIRDLSMSGEVETTTYYVGSGYANKQKNGDRIYDVGEMRCQVNLFDKSALRSAYYYAMNSFPVNNLALLSSTSTSWSSFIELYRAVAKWLCKVDSGAYTDTLGYDTPTKLATALRNKTNQIKSLNNSERQTHLAYLDHIKVYADQNGKWRLAPVDDAITTDVSGNYSKGAKIEFVSKTIPGYTYAGYVRDFREGEDEYLDSNQMTGMQPADVTTGELTVPHATGPVSCTCYYVRNDFTITYDLDGGTLADGDENPTSYNVESDDITLKEPTKPGYTFAGWFGPDGGAPQKPVTIPAGSFGDKTYTASWSAKTYTVHYEGNGATGLSHNTPMADGTFTYGVPQSLAVNRFIRNYEITYNYNYVNEESGEVYEKTDFDGVVYEFRGWNTRADGKGTTYLNRQAVTNLTNQDSITLYAQWEAMPAVLETPERPGYGFAGWYWDPACEDMDFVNVGGALFTSEEESTLYAKWAENNYTVIFNGNGATGGSTNSQLLLAGKSSPLNKNGYVRKYTVSFDACGGSVSPASATANYDFQYWTTDAAGNGTRYYDEADVVDLTDTSSIELFAQWQSVQTSLNLPEPVYPGHNFMGWYLDEAWEQPVGDAFMPTENITLYARWADAAYWITFDPKGGTDVQDSNAPLPNIMAYTIGSYDKQLPETYRTGYTFSGWKPTTSEGNWDMEKLYTYPATYLGGKYGDVTLEAQWIPIEYTITFNTQGGDSYPDAGNQRKFTIETPGTLGEPTRRGYDFAKWTVVNKSGNWGEAGTEYDADEPLAGKYGSVSLNASWELAEYTITYDLQAQGANLPESAPTKYTIEISDEVVLPAPDRNGYAFQGWKPQATSGSWLANMTYLADATKLNGNYGDVTLLAQWALATYMINFDERGGEEVANMFYTILSEETLVLPATERRAYTFSGWKPATTSGTWNENTVYPAETMVNGMCGSVTLIAQWTADEYTITFDPNGGDDYPNIENKRTYTTESQETLGAPTRDQYDFLYWTVVDKGYYDGNGEWVSDTGINNWSEIGTTYRDGAVPTHKYGHVKLQAQWTAKQFTIEYHYEGGELANGEENPQFYTIDSADFKLIEPGKVGYEFTGWTGTDLDEPKKDVTVEQGSYGNREYWAHWEPVAYTISYTLYGGALPEDVTNPETYTIETPTFRLNNPERTGYTFTGWTGTNGNEPALQINIEKGSKGPRTYMANWEPVEYTITYDLNGGTQETGVEYVSSYNIESNAVILAYHPTKIGYTFAGWTGSNGDEPQTRVVIPKGSIGNKSYTANWKIDEENEENFFSITYDLNGGKLPEGVTNPESFTVETPTFTLNNPERTGYTFKGWTGSNGADPAREVTIAQGSTGSRNYVANWDATVYSIEYTEFDAEGNTQLIAVMGNPATYTVDTADFTLNNPTKTGYEFAGWTGTDLTEASTTVTIVKGSMGDRSYTANWTATEYSITYDLKDGELPEGVTNPETYTIETPTFRLNNPVRTGYDFAGWYGTNSPEEYPETSVRIEKGSTGNREYNAKWTPKVYSIQYFDADGITPIAVAGNPTSYTVETNNFTLQNPSKAGIDFEGWYMYKTDADGNNETQVNTAPLNPMMILSGGMGNIRFVASWSNERPYHISYYDYETGDPIEDEDLNYNVKEYTYNSLVTLNPLSRSGYTFTGWTGSGIEGDTPQKIVSFTQQTGDKVFYAHWTPITYTIKLDPTENGKFEETSVPGAPRELDATYDIEVNLPQGLLKDGYNHLGWSRQPKAAQPDNVLSEYKAKNLTDVPNQTITLYAVWESKMVTLSFEGGTDSTDLSFTVNSVTCLYGTEITLPGPDDEGVTITFEKLDQDAGIKYPVRSFLGWWDDGNSELLKAGSTYTCEWEGNRTLTAVWSVDYFELEKKIRDIEGCRTNNAVPASGTNDPQYAAGSEYAQQLGSNGKYPWNNYNMSAVEAQLATIDLDYIHTLDAQIYQNYVASLLSSLERAWDQRTLLPVNYNAQISCRYRGAGFIDEYYGDQYPPCESRGMHSYNSLLAVIDEILNQSDDECMYTPQSVQELRVVVYGNNDDVVGIKRLVENARLKMPMQSKLNEYIDQMASAYHSKLDLKLADYTELDKLITEYLPSLHSDSSIGAVVDYYNLATFYTEDSVSDLREFYSNINKDYKNVYQWLIEEGGDDYEGLRGQIDALIPVDADYTDVFYLILGIATNTPGYSYPAPTVTGTNYQAWIDWARENDGNISAALDTDFLTIRYTEASLNSLYLVLDSIRWDCSIFEQGDVNNRSNPTSYYTLLSNAIGNLKSRKYTITYRVNDGTNLVFTNQSGYEYGTRIGAFPAVNPKRENYIFRGWTANPTTEVPATEQDYVYGNMSLYAIWAQDYPINYMLEGGQLPEGKSNPTHYSEESDDFTLVDPIRPGYTFAGWTGSNGDEPQHPLTIAHGSKDARSYTACWTPTRNNINYNLNGGEVDPTKPNRTYYTIDDVDIFLHNPTREGYEFTGWTGSNGDTPELEVVIEHGSFGTKTFTANWKTIIYRITYFDQNLNNPGAVKPLVDTINPTFYTIETETFYLINPEREGCTFAGWIGSNGTIAQNLVKIEKGSTGDKNFTAIWTADYFTIDYYDSDGITTLITENPTYYVTSSETFTLENPTKDGYDFIGWTGSNGDVPQTVVSIISGSMGNKSYKANWRATDYPIHYDLGGGTAVNPATYTVETETFTLTNPTRAGYEFAGWTAADLSEPLMNITIYKGSKGERSFTATWTVVGYTIAYELNGGTVEAANPTAYTVETETFTLTNPTRTGYDFAGWTGTDLTEATQEVTISKGSVGNRTYNATWSLTQYAINCDLAGGTLSEANMATYTINTASFTLHNPTRVGYVFAGWTGTDLTEATMEVTIAKGSTGDRSYTANWTAVEYAITYFDADGVTPLETTNPTSYTVESEMIVLDEPTKAGFNFRGWTGSNGETPQRMVVIAQGSTGDRSYTANWTAITFVISYDLDGGRLPSGVTNPRRYTADTDTFVLNNPTQIGYDFLGWTWTLSLDDEVLQETEMPQVTVTIEKGSIGDREYVANWAPTEYTITYDLDGGTLAEGDENPATYTIDDYFMLISPTRAGFTFAGWTGSNGDEPQKKVTIRDSIGNLNYTANWTPIEYTISYDLDGGSATNPETYTAAFETFTLTNPTRDGFVFAGWTGTDLESMTMEVTIEKGSYGDRSYTAHWATDAFTITYDLAGGTVAAANPTIYMIDTETFTLTNPTREGYTFAGWTGSNGVDPQTTVTIVKGSTGNRSFTANWTAIEYAISYELDGGSAENLTVYTIETETFTLTNPTKDGSTFAGWTGTDLTEPTMEVTIAKGSTGSRSYTATWSTDEYTISYELDGGTAENPTGYGYGTETFTLTNPTRTGYTFAGWTGTGLTEVTMTVTIAKGSVGDRSYTANWTINRYNVTITTDGHGTADADMTADVAYSSVVTLTAEPAEGYAFLRWESSDVTITNDTFTMPDSAVAVKATFAPISYTIAFNANGGINTMDAISAQYDKDVVLPACGFEREGYKFLGWAVENEYAETPEILNTASVRNLTATANATVTLYAVWVARDVELIPMEDSSTVIDQERGFIYGLDYGMTEDDLTALFLDVLGNGHVEVSTPTGMIGTGTIITLISDDTGDVVETYEIVIFGDLNGDGMLNAADVSAMRSVNARLTTYAEGSAQFMAADVNSDGMINAADLAKYRSANARLTSLSQTV